MGRWIEPPVRLPGQAGPCEGTGKGAGWDAKRRSEALRNLEETRKLALETRQSRFETLQLRFETLFTLLGMLEIREETLKREEETLQACLETLQAHFGTLNLPFGMLHDGSRRLKIEFRRPKRRARRLDEVSGALQPLRERPEGRPERLAALAAPVRRPDCGSGRRSAGLPPEQHDHQPHRRDRPAGRGVAVAVEERQAEEAGAGAGGEDQEDHGDEGRRLVEEDDPRGAEHP